MLNPTPLATMITQLHKKKKIVHRTRPCLSYIFGDAESEYVVCLTLSRQGFFITSKNRSKNLVIAYNCIPTNFQHKIPRNTITT